MPNLPNSSNLKRFSGISWWLVWVFLAAIAGPMTLASDVHAQEARPTKPGKKYRVRIDSAPQQAAIYLDDEKYGIVGYTPWSGSLQKGMWTVIVKKDGYETTRRTIEVKRQSSTQESFLLMNKAVVPATLDVRADADPSAAGAEVFVDGKSAGTLPASVTVPAGRHLVEVKKADFETFTSWVEVKDGEKATITPMLKGNAAKGSVLVDADTPDAEVYIDGTKWRDNTPTVVPDLIEGPHVVEVRKEGTAPWRQSVTVVKGQTAKVSATLGGAVGPVAPNGPTATIRVVSSMPDSEVAIDGEKVGNAPQQKEVPLGEHFISVSKPGYAKFDKKLSVGKAGETVTVSAELKAMGGVRFLSSPAGAEVLLNGESLGKTPMEKADIAVGENVITMKFNGYYDYEESIKVEGGKTSIVNAQLKMVDDGPTDEDLETEQKGLSSFGARTLPAKRTTVDAGVGYPYFLDTRITIGAGDLVENLGFDFGLLLRTNLPNYELGLIGRMKLFDHEPFAFGVFTDIGFGQAFFDESKRNSFFWEGGAAASLTGMGAVTLTGRGYLSFWSQRFCPGREGNGFDSEATPTELCEDYAAGMLEPADKARIDKLLGGEDEIFNRDNGMRFMASLIIEIAVQQQWNVWVMFEGAPFQGERAAYTDVMNPLMLKRDNFGYFRIGGTYKF